MNDVDTSPQAVLQRRAFVKAAKDVQDRRERRRKELWAMGRGALRELANDYMLPQDLQRPSLIEAIVRKEIPPR